MGTRNVTSVILDGKQVVCQYCQWDGYPSCAGVKILEFLRDTDQEHFKKALANTKISVTDYLDAKTYTGSTKDVSDIVNQVWNEQVERNKDRKPEEPYVGTYETVKHMLEEGKLTAEQADDYLVSTRDTGCEILSYICDRALDRQPLELFAITDEYNGDYSFDIQGIYVIDLDKQLVNMRYDGYVKEYSLAELPENIDFEMRVFEEITGKMYELTYEKFDFAALAEDAAKEENAGFLLAKASEIAMEVAKEFKENNPELLSDPEKPLQPEDFGLEYICKLLREKALARVQERKPSLEAQVLQATESAENLNDNEQPAKPAPAIEPEH